MTRQARAAGDYQPIVSSVLTTHGAGPHGPVLWMLSQVIRQQEESNRLLAELIRAVVNSRPR